MKVVILSCEVLGARFKVTKRIDGALNEHYIPTRSVKNYACFYGVTDEQALDLILFEPFLTEEDKAHDLVETVQNIKTRVQAGEGLAACHQTIMEEVSRHGEVQETNLDSPSSDRGPTGEPGTGEQYRERRDHSERGTDGGVGVSGTVRDSGSTGERSDDGAAEAAGTR
jgi:hypothetical protein